MEGSFGNGSVKTFLGKSITKKQYKEFLSDKIHTYGKNRQKFSSVQINFVFHHNRKKIHYEIKREWESDGNEILTVKKSRVASTYKSSTPNNFVPFM